MHLKNPHQRFAKAGFAFFLVEAKHQQRKETGKKELMVHTSWANQDDSFEFETSNIEVNRPS